MGEPAGDQEAFARLVEPHRGRLQAHCYRMLGSVQDAEDALQETMLRAWRGRARLEERSAPRAWLYAIATNVCLDACARRRRRRVLPMDHGPPTGEEPGPRLPPSTWIEPYPDAQIDPGDGRETPDATYERRESVELAFIAALQHLPPRGRAVLIMREVLGFSARETADALRSSEASVNSALQRARATLGARLPSRSQQQTLRDLGDEGVRALVRRFIDAFERADVDAIVALLADDAVFAMPPYSGWARGRDAVTESWLMPSGPPDRLRYVVTRANGQLALGTYARDPRRGTFTPIALDVLTLSGAEIVQVLAFRDIALFERFALPPEVVHSSPRASR